MPEAIRNRLAPMQYRRFGKTEKQLSVITLGGMRYAKAWQPPRDQLRPETIDNCRDCVQRALAAGINHIETAFGYGTSEAAYGRVLNEELRVPRTQYHLMTKGRSMTGGDTRKAVERQMRALGTDHIELYAWHGLNTEACFETATAKDGPVETLHKMVDEGLIGHVGFSTHAHPDIVQRAIATGLFSFVNLHYYYFSQAQRRSVDLAAERDMGVFIISPNDKGGRLYDPPPLLRELTAPLTPIQWNARFCLSTPAVHTLSFGMTAPQHFHEMLGVLPVSTPLSPTDQAILERLDAQLDRDPYSRYQGWELYGDPSGIHVPELLRLRRLYKCYDMLGYGRFRYNMLKNPDPWYPGALADETTLAKMDERRFPPGIDIKQLLRETHAALFTNDAPETGH